MVRWDVLEAGETGHIVIVRWLGQRIFKTAALVRGSWSAVVSIYQQWSKEGTVITSGSWPAKAQWCTLTGLHCCRTVRVPMLTLVHDNGHVSIRIGPRRNGKRWADKSRFPLYHMEGWVHAHHLFGGHLAPLCTMGGKKAGGGSVRLWAMLYWETLGSSIRVDVIWHPPPSIWDLKSNLSICGVCLTNNPDPWRPQLTTFSMEQATWGPTQY